MPETPSQPLPALLPLGVDGVLVKVAMTAAPRAAGEVHALLHRLERAEIPAVTEIAPSLTSILVRFDPAETARQTVAEAIRAVMARQDWHRESFEDPTRRWTVPACFAGDHAPQLAEAAAEAGIGVARAVEDLTTTELRVLAIGFAPGQPYLGLLPETWNFPRQSGLTPQVPVGAVCVAVRQVVMFSIPSPTGWRQAGRAAFQTFQPESDTPFPLNPGDALRYMPVSEDEIAALLASGDPMGGATCEVLA